VPYQPDSPNLPDNVKALPAKERRRWVEVWNSAFSRCMDENDDADKCEAFAFKNANGIAFQQETYQCECIECGHQMESEEHCVDIKCPECGGTMRRVERPGRGQPQFQFTVNQTAAVRRESLDGIEYLVAPTVAIKAGVLNEELVPEEEIGKHLQAWAGRPFVVGHPKDADGSYVTANDPQRLAQCAIGQFFPSDFEDGKLRGDIWVDMLKAQRLGGNAAAVLKRLQSGTPLEVSTAYFRDLEEKAGEHEGKPYVGVARNLRPDHIAALLDVEGACSWQDGCGAPRVNEGGDVETTKSKLRQAFETISDALKMNIGGSGMDYQKAIVDDGRLGLEADVLEGLDEGVLETLASYLESNPVEGPPEVNEPKDPDPEPKAKEPGDSEPQTNETPCVSEVLDKAFADFGGVEGVKSILAGLKANADQQRAELVAKLKANEKCAFTVDRLKAMELGDLEALHRTLSPADYSGRGGGPVSNVEKAEALKMPSLYEEAK